MSTPGDPETLRLEKRTRKALLALAALGALANAPAHGYALAQRLRDVLGESIPEGTLYPLIASFEAAGWVRHDWDTSSPGPARKVHQLTQDGHAALASMTENWRVLSRRVEELLP